jgi:hypothetical protein
MSAPSAFNLGPLGAPLQASLYNGITGAGMPLAYGTPAGPLAGSFGSYGNPASFSPTAYSPAAYASGGAASFSQPFLPSAALGFGI